MKIDLKGFSRKDLEKLQRDIARALERLDQADKKAALEAAEKAARAHGFSLSQLTGGKIAKPAGEAAKKEPKARAKKPADGRAKVDPKYRNPKDASQTWTGRGRSPKWVAEHLAAGGTLDDIRI